MLAGGVDVDTDVLYMLDIGFLGRGKMELTL